MAIDHAKADAALQNLQTATLEEAKRDFGLWKSSTLMPGFQAKEAKASAAGTPRTLCLPTCPEGGIQ